jgi:hypothetical protein
MAAEKDAPTTEDEWQFSDLESGQAPAFGGGLLQSILDEVTALRADASEERASLTQAMASALGKIEGQVAELDKELGAVRSEMEATSRTAAEAIEALRVSIEAQSAFDVAGMVENAIALQFAKLRQAIPTEHMAKVATEVRQLRTLLVGSS